MGSRIREARKAANMTQAELAAKIGINRATLSKYESGIIEPSVAQLRLIADALNVTVGYLTGYESMGSKLFLDALYRKDVRELERLSGLPEGALLAIGPDVDAIEEKQEGIRKGYYYAENKEPVISMQVDLLEFESCEEQMIYFYSLLNDEGRRVAANRVQELSEIAKYRKDSVK